MICVPEVAEEIQRGEAQAGAEGSAGVNDEGVLFLGLMAPVAAVLVQEVPYQAVLPGGEENQVAGVRQVQEGEGVGQEGAISGG